MFEPPCQVLIASFPFQVTLPPGAQHSDEKGAKEAILEDDECPLQIFREWPSDKGNHQSWLGQWTVLGETTLPSGSYWLSYR